MIEKRYIPVGEDGVHGGDVAVPVAAAPVDEIELVTDIRKVKAAIDDLLVVNLTIGDEPLPRPFSTEKTLNMTLM